jgi:hypothetical protein
MNIGGICEELKRRADTAQIDLKIDKSGEIWYAVLVTRKDSYSNLLVRSFEARSLNDLVRRVRFPYRTPDGRAVYV